MEEWEDVRDEWLIRKLESKMKRFFCLVLLMPLLTTGCATAYVRTLGKTTIYDGPAGAVVWTNGNIGVKDLRYEVTEPRYSEHPVTQRYFCATRTDIVARTNEVTRDRYVRLDYHRFPVNEASATARLIEDTLATSGLGKRNGSGEVKEVWNLDKGFGGIYPLEYSLPGSTVKLAIGPQFSHQTGEYRKTWSIIMQPLLIPAVAIDIVTSPIQVFYWIHRINKTFKD